MRTFVVILLLCYTSALSGNSFRHLNVADGLSSRRVYQVKQDSAGFMWFFTYSGIDRYDGSEIRHYAPDEMVQAPKNTLFLTKLLLDRDKNIWVAMTDGKIFYYDRKLDGFILRIDLARHLKDQAIMLTSAVFDRDKLWLCMSTGLYCFDLPENRLDFISSFGGEQVIVATAQNDRTLYVGTQRNVYRLERNSEGNFSVQPLIPGISSDIGVESLMVHQNKLYVGTFSNSLLIVNLTDHKVVSLGHTIPNVPVRTITPAADGRIFIGADGAGFYSISAKTGQLIEKYISNEDVSTGLKGNTVCDICVDACNYVWVATTTNGISILGPQLSETSIVRHEYKNDNSLADNHVNAILEDSGGDLWYGTNNGVSLYRVKSKAWKHFLREKEETGAVILALCEDADGHIWAGGFGIGAFCIDKHTGRVYSLPARQSSSGLSTNYIYSIYADDRDVWFGGINGALTQYNIRTGTYRYHDVDCIYDIQPGDDRILLLSSCMGLIILNRDNGSIVSGAFNDYPVRSLYRSSDGNLWLATDGRGLICYDMDTGNTDFYTMENETASNSILSIRQDKTGRIWFSSENGLYCVDPRNRQIINMDAYVAIGNDYNANASLKRKNGKLVFGTANGAVEFSPNFVLDDDQPVKLIFTDFRLFNKPAKINSEDSPLKCAINETELISLKYSQNSFSFSFSSINYSYLNKTQYRCMLEGFEDSWQEAAGQAGYTNISPGRYEFRLRAVNTLTRETADERVITVIIAKPLWATDWAFMIYFGFFAILVLFVVRYIRTQMEERNSKEKINFFVNLAHDIRTPVALIKAPLSELERENLTAYGRKTLSIALKNTDKLSSMISQLLDFQKADSMSMKLVVTKNNLYAYLREKFVFFKVAARQKGVRLEMKADFERLEVYFDRNKMDKIIDNLLSNAIKYTPEKGFVHMAATRDSEKWSLEVTDTGIGIPAAEQKNLFTQFYRAKNAINSKESGSGIGLLLTRKLVQLHGGDIQFSSVEDGGSSFKVCFPVKISKADIMQDMDFAEDEEVQSGKNAGERILVVEDNDDMRAYLNDTLSKEHQVFELSDGQQVIEQVGKINPDIIISDILMPHLNGDEMCRILKSSIETSHIPIILLTALNDRENIIKGLEYGADDYIVKPFDSAVLKARIRNIIDNRGKLRETLLSGHDRKEEVDYPNPLDKEFMEKVIASIEEELASPEFSINGLCMSIGMSRTPFYHKLKTLTGMSPNQFIKTLRLNKARELLQSKRYNVSEVAIIVGFSDSKYFSTSFKKQFGYSPSKFG
ncbi:MAG: response regulator [Bacteroidales bacterium]|jgi:signal transduction histidine kinase/DNA-binding response OmpR family regulator/ligand-binding sensor domain-containing protein|nr:response regulator [Bacteroidales bacterium]